MTEAEIAAATRFFQRRHVYEHNGGEVDEKYLGDSGDTSVRLKQATLSPSFDSRADPQHGHCVGTGRTTRSRSMSSGKGRRTGRLRLNERTVSVFPATFSAASSSSVAVASSSSSSKL
jgi:hypothetical protein